MTPAPVPRGPAATTDVTDVQEQVDAVAVAPACIGTVVETINETQTVIDGVLTEQVAVTRAICI